MAVLKALPTTDDIQSAGAADAAAFMQSLDPEAHHAFLLSANTHADWGEPPKGEPIHLRLDHLIRLIIGTMEAQIGRTPAERDGCLSEAEVKRWIAKLAAK